MQPLQRGALGAGQCAQLAQLRLSAGEESTRAELQLDAAPGDYRLFSLANPDRLVLDLPGAALADGFRPPAPNGRVIGVRTGSPEAGKLRIVFDLAGAGQLSAYRHEGFWQPMDTFRESKMLNDLWSSGEAPWKLW